MNMFFTLSALVRLAFWLLVVGIVLGLALSQPRGETPPDPATEPVDVLLWQAPVSPLGEGRW